MNQVKLKALQTFASLGGRIRAGRVFETNEERAAYLTSEGLAERLSGPASTQVSGPSATQPRPEPTELNDDITAVGGGWFEWRGKRYRGHARAEAAKTQGG